MFIIIIIYSIIKLNNSVMKEQKPNTFLEEEEEIKQQNRLAA
jgi:hypothetical protein